MTRLKSARGRVKLTGSPAARKLATAVLEVLAGLITPTDAGQAVGITVQRYYALEGRALQGLIAALEPKHRGRHQTPQGELAMLRSDNTTLQRQVGRLTALVRTAHRASGLADGKLSKKIPGQRTRKPSARVFKAIAVLHEEASQADDAAKGPASQEA
jgi:hypothetical protein